MRHFALPLALALVFAAGCRSARRERASEPPPEPMAETELAPQEPTQPPPVAGDQDFLGQERERLTLEQQKSALLVEQHIANARSFMDQLRLEEAERELTNALALQPENLEAKQLLDQVSGLLGRTPGEAAGIVQDLRERHQVRVQQMRAEAEESLRKAKLALARGDYDMAIAELTIAQNHIRWAPYSIDWQGMDEEVRRLLEQARAQRGAAAEEAQRQAQEQALESLREQDQAERARRQAELGNMIDQAIAAFDAGRYEDAIEFSEQALRVDPRNDQAQEIRDAAFRAGRAQVRGDYVLAKREQFRRWRETLEGMRVPNTDIITLPDQDYWSEVTTRRKARRGIDLTRTETEAERELRQALESTRITSLRVADEESLEAVIGQIRTMTGLPLVVDPAAENAAVEAGVVFNFNLENPLTVRQALDLVTNQAGEDVTWTVRHDAVLITTRTKARGIPVIYNHDVQDLVFGLTDFLGPRIDRLRLLDEMEDEDGGGPFGGLGERPKLIEISALSTLLQENVAVGTWEEEGVSIAEGEGYILVVHTPEVQEEVRQFLNDLRRFSSSLVTIESKFMTVSSNWLQEIGVDFRGLDNPNSPFKDLDDVTNGLEDMASRGLDNSGLGAASGNPSAGFFYDDGQDGDFKGRTENFFGKALGSTLSNIGGLTAQYTFLNDLEVSAILRAIEKSSDFQLVNNQVLSVHNTQRAFVSVINQRAYIQDFDVEVAQFQAVADPQINVLTEGVVLDVRPTIHHSRKYLTLEIQPTVAKVVALRTFSSTLGGNTAPVEFQLPELQVQSVFTTAVIPDGGSILLGGLSNIRNVERRAEVPWLAKLPVAGFFFKQEGYDDENRTLMILIRAHITDVREDLARREGAR
jgi:type II secretory pathway component GspD/PulD (secretin)